ncbi:hypothetical protein, partial [Neisseria sicca]|uniref:hypothetical protein n=1 Tax=Neisseria sicca TaxID=490 RepID=UPI001C990880
AQRFGRFAEGGNNGGGVGYMGGDEIEMVGGVLGEVDMVVEIEVGGEEEGMFGIWDMGGMKKVNTVEAVGAMGNGGERVDVV